MPQPAFGRFGRNQRREEGFKRGRCSRIGSHGDCRRRRRLDGDRGLSRHFAIKTLRASWRARVRELIAHRDGAHEALTGA
jgi:hypothetical protein